MVNKLYKSGQGFRSLMHARFILLICGTLAVTVVMNWLMTQLDPVLFHHKVKETPVSPVSQNWPTSPQTARTVYSSTSPASQNWPTSSQTAEKVHSSASPLSPNWLTSPHTAGKVDSSTSPNRSFRVLFPDVHFQLTSRPDAMRNDFSQCQYNNCILTHSMSERPRSDALIIVGRQIGHFKTPFPRTPEQIWIFHQIESPQHYDLQGTEWRTDPGWRSGFNWSMTYDYINTDVHFPYGGITTKLIKTVRNYTEIALGKTKDALLVSSHCGNSAKREIYAKRLQKYITVDLFGGCGKKWNCGHLYVHDSCFDILNTTYRYFLAFENSLCRSYFTEKLFENFNYDVLIVTRGGEYGQATKLFPKGSVISTDSFESADALGKYLSEISASVSKYASLLQGKDQYEAISYKATYQKALCQICEMLNNQDKYRRHIPDTYNWTYSQHPCRQPTDLP